MQIMRSVEINVIAKPYGEINKWASFSCKPILNIIKNYWSNYDKKRWNNQAFSGEEFDFFIFLSCLKLL